MLCGACGVCLEGRPICPSLSTPCAIFPLHVLHVARLLLAYSTTNVPGMAVEGEATSYAQSEQWGDSGRANEAVSNDDGDAVPSPGATLESSEDADVADAAAEEVGVGSDERHHDSELSGMRLRLNCD